MARLLALDLETTGLDIEKDEITEIGWVLKDTEIDKPLLTEGYMLKVSVPVPKIITEITGITDEILGEFGQDPAFIFSRLIDVIQTHKVEYVVAHNGENFDKPMLHNNMKRQNLVLPPLEWIDTRSDVRYPGHVKNRNLVALCAEHGFLNPFPHAALFDSMATMRLLSSYPIEEVLEYRSAPNVIVRAMVTYEERDLAKAKGFRWQEVGGKMFKKQWVKQIKEMELPLLKEECEFQIGVVG
jgi:DNA polymerase-3 subunit epsilon